MVYYQTPMKLIHNAEVAPEDDKVLYLVSQDKTRLAKGLKTLTQAENIEIGLKNEDAIHHILEAKFNCDLFKDTDIYGKCDFYNNEVIADATIGVECKGRVDIAHDLYADGGFVDVHKVEAHLAGKQYYYVFTYNDGIFYTPYDKARFDTYRINTNFTEYRKELGRYEKSPKYEIPPKDMRKICLFNL